MKDDVIKFIKEEFGGKIDLLIYSLASGVRTDPIDGVTYRSALKSTTKEITGPTINFEKETMEETTGTLTLFLGAVAAISLVVGGIGIMNIMLVSVTERTREIGVRKALGATYNVIVTQFLIEAIVISLMGGIIGIILGVGSSKLIGMASGMSTVISIPTIVMSFAFSVAIGLVFGIYPARKAAKLNPIDALHYE